MTIGTLHPLPFTPLCKELHLKTCFHHQNTVKLIGSHFCNQVLRRLASILGCFSLPLPKASCRGKFSGIIFMYRLCLFCFSPRPSGLQMRYMLELPSLVSMYLSLFKYFQSLCCTLDGLFESFSQFTSRCSVVFTLLGNLQCF